MQYAESSYLAVDNTGIAQGINLPKMITVHLLLTVVRISTLFRNNWLQQEIIQ